MSKLRRVFLICHFQLRYGDVQGKADLFDEGGSSIERGETTDLTFESSVETNLAIYNEEIEKYLSGFLHRGSTVTSPSTCKGKLLIDFSMIVIVWIYRSNSFDTVWSSKSWLHMVP